MLCTPQHFFALTDPDLCEETRRLHYGGGQTVLHLGSRFRCGGARDLALLSQRLSVGVPPKIDYHNSQVLWLKQPRPRRFPITKCRCRLSHVGVALNVCRVRLMSHMGPVVGMVLVCLKVKR